jgi:hypothetical protein
MANYQSLLTRAEHFECQAAQVKRQGYELKQQGDELKRRFIDQFIIGTKWDKQYAEWIKHYTHWNIYCNSQIIERSNQLSERTELLKIAPRDTYLNHIEGRDHVGNPLFDQITQLSNELKQLAYELKQQAKWVKQLVDQRAEQAQTIKKLSTHLVKLDKRLRQQSEQPISTSSISYVQYNELKQMNADLQRQLALANQKIAMLASEFHFEFTLLKQQNAELLHQRDNYPVATAVAIAAPSASDDPNDTKMHLARNISTQNMSEWMDQ